MSAVKTISATPLDAVSIEHDDGAPYSHVWLRRDIVKDTADDGPESGYEFYSAEELYFKVAGTPSVAEITDSFDALWDSHVNDDVTIAERVEKCEETSAIHDAAILEICDMIAGGEQ